MEVTINLPEDVAQSLLVDDESIERKVLESFALKGFRGKRFSFEQIIRMIELNSLETENFLKTHGVLSE